MAASYFFLLRRFLLKPIPRLSLDPIRVSSPVFFANATAHGEARRCSYRLSVLLSPNPIRVSSPVFRQRSAHGEARRCSYRLSVLLSPDPIRVSSSVFSPTQHPRRSQALFLPPVRFAEPGLNSRLQPRFSPMQRPRRSQWPS